MHGQIFETLSKLIASGKRVTPVTLAPFFEAAEPLDADTTVPIYLGRLGVNATTTINARDYGRTIHELATRRQLILIGEDLVDRGYDPTFDPSDRNSHLSVDVPTTALMEDAQKKLFSLAETHPDRLGETERLLCLDDVGPRDAGDYVLRDVFGRGEVGTLWSISQGGKGFWSAELSKRLVLGRPVFGRPTLAVPVLQVQYEGGRGLKCRIAAVAADLSPEDRALFAKCYAWRQNPPPLGPGSAGDQGEAAIIRDARTLEKRAGAPVGLITIDTVAKALPGESLNNDDVISHLFARGRRIAAATGAAVMFVTHPGHENRGRPAGSYQFMGSSDFLLMIISYTLVALLNRPQPLNEEAS